MARGPSRPAAPAAPAPAEAPKRPASAVSGVQLAQVLGVDDRSIRRSAGLGHLVKVGRDQYELFPSILKYVQNLREQAAARNGGEQDAINTVTEGALLKRAVRHKKEMEAQELAGALIAVSEIETVMADHIKGVRAMVLAFPSMAQAVMPHLNAMDIETLKTVARELLQNNAVRAIEETGMHPEISEKIARKRGYNYDEEPKATPNRRPKTNIQRRR